MAERKKVETARVSTYRTSNKRAIKLKNKPARSVTSQVAKFGAPSRGSSIWQLTNTIIPYLICWGLSYFAIQRSIWLAIPFIILTSMFMMRTFVLFHDCGHQSFFHSRKANDFWGVVTGLLTFTPYRHWHGSHARHHASSGNLDRRGHGDIWTMTVSEFREATPWLRFKYRLYRNPVIMFLIGPLFVLFVAYRTLGSCVTARERRSVILTNISLVVIAIALSAVMGPLNYLIIQLGVLYIGMMVGIWFFYVQHQFEDVYWARQGSWDFVTAALEGGSFYDLPIVLRWFTGSIGYHHIHHLNAKIPNYRLAECHKRVPEALATPRLGIRKSFRALRYRLLDEKSGKMVSFRDVRGDLKS